MESHNHLMMLGYLSSGLDLTPDKVSAMDQIVSLVKNEADNRPAGSWIKGSGYAEYFLRENRHPTRRDLDPVSPNHPVILYHTSLHAAALNSQALAVLGLDRNTPNPVGGLLERDPETGDLIGVIHDAVLMDVINRLFIGDLAAMNQEDRIDLCGRATELFASLGLTMASDALVMPDTLKIYQEAQAAGRLKIRVYTMNLVDLAEPLVQAGIRTGFGNGWLRIGPIKMFADGGMSNRTAAVVEPLSHARRKAGASRCSAARI